MPFYLIRSKVVASWQISPANVMSHDYPSSCLQRASRRDQLASKYRTSQIGVEKLALGVPSASLPYEPIGWMLMSIWIVSMPYQSREGKSKVGRMLFDLVQEMLVATSMRTLSFCRVSDLRK